MAIAASPKRKKGAAPEVAYTPGKKKFGLISMSKPLFFIAILKSLKNIFSNVHLMVLNPYPTVLSLSGT